jgi:hypothetical protein
LLLALLFCCVWVLPAQAVPITFTFTGSLYGAFENNNIDPPFGDFRTIDISVTIPADTADTWWHNADLANNSGPNGGLPPNGNPFGLTGSIALSGIGTGNFVNPLYVYVSNANNENQTPSIGFCESIHVYSILGLNLSGEGLETYGLSSSFGPIYSSSTVGYAYNPPLQLTNGYLWIIRYDNATFSASTVPLPSTVLLLGSGLLGLVGWRKFRKS